VQCVATLILHDNKGCVTIFSLNVSVGTLFEKWTIVKVNCPFMFFAVLNTILKIFILICLEDIMGGYYTGKGESIFYKMKYILIPIDFSFRSVIILSCPLIFLQFISFVL
jgi:hypothetical protein